MRILIAPLEFKGTLTAVEAANALAAGLLAASPAFELDLLPMADGGPGTLDAVLTATRGERRHARVLDPLMRPIEAEWGLLSDGSALVECASASGLWRLRPEELDPRRASTFGTGQLIAAALAAGCRTIHIGLGGSATNDGGAGMAQALGYRLLDAEGRDIAPGGWALASLRRIDASAAHPGIENTTYIGATDVTNPLCGPAGASAMFGPQKGADAATVEELDAALANFAALIKRDLGVDVQDVVGAGAAGGLGAGLMAFLAARLTAGAAMIGELAHLAERCQAADLVITGEGRLDAQTAFGKGPAFIAGITHEAGRPCICVAGSIAPGLTAARLFDVVEAVSEARAALPTKDKAIRELTTAAERLGRRLPVLVDAIVKGP